MVEACYNDLKLEDFPLKTETVIDNPVLPPEEKYRPSLLTRYRWWMALFFLFAALVFLGIQRSTQDAVRHFTASLKAKIHGPLQVDADGPAKMEKAVKRPPAALNRPETAPVSGLPETVSAEKGSPVVKGVIGQEKDPEHVPETMERTQPETRVVTVQPGDSLGKLAMRIYGRFDERIIAFIQEANPGIKNINQLLVGQTILFPWLEDRLPTPSDGPEREN